jgi:hypothetical protein
MKKYYAALANYTSEECMASLVDGIDPTQKGNESRFDSDISKYPIDLRSSHKSAAAIGKPLHKKN